MPYSKKQITPSFSEFETELMQSLIKQAAAFQGYTFPNPVVGAAVYKDEHIISFGMHKEKGTDHAEVVALKAAGEQARIKQASH